MQVSCTFVVLNKKTGFHIWVPDTKAGSISDMMRQSRGILGHLFHATHYLSFRYMVRFFYEKSINLD